MCQVVFKNYTFKYIMNEFNKIQKNLARMPKEVVKLILFYTHSYQPKALLNDIENINIIKKDILQKYLDFWEDDESNYWVVNDIFSYANEYHATMYGYRDKFYDIFLRHISIKNNLQVHKYIKNVWKKTVKSQINILLGLLTPEERGEFIISAFW